MYEHVEVEFHHETLKKVEKLACSLGLTVDELINRSIRELLHEREPTDT